MSARGFLATGPRSRPIVLAESKRYIPLFWLSFLSSNDIENAPNTGQFELDRKRAVDRGANSLPFLSALFPQVPAFEAIGSSFLAMLGAQRSRTIRMDVEELVDDFEPNLRTAIDAIESRSTDYTLTVPAQPGVNPFTGEVQMSEERRFDSMADMLLLVCMIPAEDLTSRSKELVHGTILGHVQD